MGVVDREGALYMATGIDNTGFYRGKQEAMGIIKAMAREITSFDVFGGIGISAGIAFAQAAKDAYTFEKQFESSMKEVATISDIVKNSMDAVKNQIISLTTDEQIPVGANEMAKALYQIVSAGHDGADGMHILEVSAKSAVGGLTETATAADAITTILNAYKKSASEADAVSDMLFTTAKLGKTTFGEMGKSISQVAPIAASFGIEMNQVLAAVATLTKSGVPTAQAMTQIRAAIIGASKQLGDGAFQTKTFQEALQSIADKANGSESALRAMMPEIEGFNGLLGLTGINAKAAADDLEAMGKATGATEKAFKEMSASAENQLKLLGNNITELLRPLGKGLLEEVSKVSTAINQAFNDGKVQESLKSLGDLVLLVTGAFLGYKGAIVLTGGAKKAHLAVSKLITDQIERERAAEYMLMLQQQASGKTSAAVQVTMVNSFSKHQLLTRALKAQAAAYLKNTAAMLTNPYVLAAGAVALLGYGLYKLATMESIAERATRKHREEQEKFKKTVEDRRQKIEDLLRVLRDESETEVKKAEAYRELQVLSPSLTAAYSKEALAVSDLTEANKLLNKERDKLGAANIQENIKRLQAEIKVLQETQDIQVSQTENSGVGLRGKLPFEDDIEAKREELDRYINDMRKLRQLEKDARPVEVKLVEAQAELPQIQQEFEKAKKKLDEEREKLKNTPFYVIPFTVELDVLNAEKKLKEMEGRISSLKEGASNTEGEKTDAIKNKAYWEKLKNDAEEALSKMDSSRAGSKGWNDLKRRIAEYKEEIDKYGVSDSSKSIVEQKKNEEKYKALLAEQMEGRKRLFEDLQMQVDESRIKAMDEGSEKTMAQMELNFEKELQAIDRQKEDILRKKVEDARSEFEANPKNKDKVFDGSGIKLSDDEMKMFDEMYKSAIEKSQLGKKKLYDSLIAQLTDFKSREEVLTKEWDEKIMLSQITGDETLRQRLLTGKEKALGELNAQMLQQSDEWVKLFGDLDNLTISEIEKLVRIIKSKAKEMKLDPVNLDAVLKKLKEAEDTIRTRNPFKSLAESIKKFREETDKEKKDAALRDIFKDVSSSLALVQSGFDSVTNGLKEMGLAGDEETQKLLSGISKMIGSASELAEGIASKNPVAIISGAAGLISSTFEVFDKRSRRANREIKKHQESLKELQKQYRELERATGKALGEDRFKGQLEQAKNYQKQIDEIQGMISAEQSKRKKKRDQGKIDDWESQKEDLKDKIGELRQGVVDELSTTDIYSYSSDLAKSIVDGFSDGIDDASVIIDDKMKDLLRNVIAKQFDVMVIQKAMKPMFDAMADGFDIDSEKGFGLSDKELDKIVSEGEKGKEQVSNSLDSLKKVLERLGLIKDEVDKELEGGVTGKLNAAMTEGTANELVGLWNMTAMDIRKLLELSTEHFTGSRACWANIYGILEQARAIAANTGQTAKNTKEIVDKLDNGLKAVKDELSEIKKNTKSNSSRG